MKSKLFYFFIAVFAISFSSNSQTTTKCPDNWAFPHCISLMGPGTPNGNWDDDNYLSTEDGDVFTAVDWQFSKGEIKFRQDGCWDLCPGNPAGWGPVTSAETGWPTGSNTAPVPFGPNIQCPGGVWNVKFTLSTQSWEFTPGTPNPVVKVVGSAVTNSPVEMTTKDGKMYTAKKVAIQPGLCQFNIDGVILGGNTFPNGSALSETEYIPISTTGIDYDITFDYTTAEYTFKVATFPGVALVGAGAGGWPGEPGNPGPIDNNQMTTTDGVTYKLEGVALTTGSVKFRQDNAWNNNWGGETFPTGPGSSDKTKDIPAVAGAYNVTFNITNGDYNFEVITYAIVGSAVGGWPGEPGNPGPIDVHQMTTTDGVNYTLDGLVCTDGGAKFRLNNAWNGGDWGGTTFPEGMGKSSSDIPVKAGTYNLSMNRVTGDYKFDDGLSVRDFTAAGFRAYPNPTKNYWNITSANDAITSVQVYDMLGKSVMVLTPSSNEVSVNSSKLSKGIYFAKVSTATASSTVKLIKE